MRVPDGMIAGGGVIVAAAVFFGSADVTHWVMGLRHTDVVVRQGPTVYVTTPAGKRHTGPRVPYPASDQPASGQPARAGVTVPPRRHQPAPAHHAARGPKRGHAGDQPGPGQPPARPGPGPAPGPGTAPGPAGGGAHQAPGPAKP